MASGGGLMVRLVVICGLLLSACGGGSNAPAGSSGSSGNVGAPNSSSSAGPVATRSPAAAAPSSTLGVPAGTASPAPTRPVPVPGGSSNMLAPSATAAAPTALASAGGSGGAGSPSITGTYPDFADGGNGRFPQLLVDAAGVRHYLYQRIGTDPATGTTPLRYGECSIDCTSPTNWSFVSIGDLGALGGFGKLALTAQGQPRLVWASAAGINGPYSLNLGSCDADCTTAASWIVGSFKTLGSFETIYTDATRNLAIDGSGRVHLVYFAGSKLHYETCAASCNAAAGWSEVLVGAYNGRASLAVTPSGQVRVALTTADTNALVYRSCESNCGQAASWAPEVALYASNRGQVSLRLDAQGRPRILYDEANAGQPGFDDLVFAAWCDTACNTTAGWAASAVGLAPRDGIDGLDFDLDANGEPVGAFQSAGTELVILRCTSACWTLQAAWAIQTVETGDTLAAEVVAPLPGCTGTNPSPVAFWYPGEQTSVALNPVTHLLEVAHRAYTLTKCYLNDNVIEGVSIPRYSGGF